MYSITFCRCGKILGKPNRGAKGKFIKNFNTLSDLAFFITKSKFNLFFPNIKNELTKKELVILSNKIASIRKYSRSSKG